MPVRNYANAPATALTNSCSALATSIVVNSVSGLPISYPFTLIIDRGTATEEAVSVTAAAGTTLTVTRGIDGTTAFAHTKDAVVVHGITAQDLREPNAHINANNGVHGVTGDVVGTTDAQVLTNKTFNMASNTLAGTKTQFNGAVSDGNPVWDDEIGLWQAYTPSVTNITLGTGGAISGRYVTIGKTVHFQARVTFGTGLALNSYVGISLPVTRVSLPSDLGAHVIYVDSGTNSYMGIGYLNASQVICYVLQTNGAFGVISGTSPFTWAAGDSIWVNGSYEAA